MFNKFTFAVVPALFLAACGGDAAETSDASGAEVSSASGVVDVAGNWNCTAILQDQNFNVVMTVMMNFDEGSGDQNINFLRTDRAGNKLTMKSNSQFNYAQDANTLSITMTATELEEASVNDQPQRGGQLVALKRDAERLPSKPVTIEMTPTPSGMVEFLNVGMNQKMECSRA